MKQLELLTSPKVEQTGPPQREYFTYIDIGCIDNLTKRIVEPKLLPVIEAPSRAKQRLQQGDVIVAMTRPNLNAVALVPAALDGAIGSTGFHVLRANDAVLPQWLFYGVQTRRFIGEMLALVQGALYPAVRPRDIRAFFLHLPSLDDQRERVAEIEKQFSRLDQAIANLQRVKANLKRYRRSLLEIAFAGASNATLGDLLASGPQNGLYLPKTAYGNGTPILRIDDYQTDWIRSRNELRCVAASPAQIEAWRLNPGDLVINRVNSMTHLGKCAVAPPSLSGTLFESNMMRMALKEIAVPRFVELYLGSALGKKRLTQSAKWAVNQASINQQDVRATLIHLPPLAEQHRIVAEIDRRLSISRGVEAQVEADLQRAQSLRQAVLAKAFGVPESSHAPT